MKVISESYIELWKVIWTTLGKYVIKQVVEKVIRDGDSFLHAW